MSLILLALQLEQVISDRAKANLVTSTGGANPRPLAISPNPVTPINTRAEIAKNTGVIIFDKSGRSVRPCARGQHETGTIVPVLSLVRPCARGQHTAFGSEGVPEVCFGITTKLS